ncbi:MAG: RNHCP domain-containing protein [Trueperaceae bacterium]|nr:RNHCP domain-containing protein [Trueperaceae bacterium]
MKRFTVRGANQGFTCVECGAGVRPLANGSVRNHCPHCLHSLHVDVGPGDRGSDCGGVLEPIGVEPGGKGDWTLVHRCRRCGAVRRNRAALDDPQQPDDYERIVQLTTQVATPGRTVGRRSQ